MANRPEHLTRERRKKCESRMVGGEVVYKYWAV